jgi:hypothetical protein
MSDEKPQVRRERSTSELIMKGLIWMAALALGAGLLHTLADMSVGPGY